ncbi:MAG: hypothetical protein RLZ71_274, partial [Actinomycetota bacterium]
VTFRGSRSPVDECFVWQVFGFGHRLIVCHSVENKKHKF